MPRPIFPFGSPLFHLKYYRYILSAYGRVLFPGRAQTLMFWIRYWLMRKWFMGPPEGVTELPSKKKHYYQEQAAGHAMCWTLRDLQENIFLSAVCFCGICIGTCQAEWFTVLWSPCPSDQSKKALWVVLMTTFIFLCEFLLFWKIYWSWRDNIHPAKEGVTIHKHMVPSDITEPNVSCNRNILCCLTPSHL